jgi:hypothetical protein
MSLMLIKTPNKRWEHHDETGKASSNNGSFVSGYRCWRVLAVNSDNRFERAPAPERNEHGEHDRHGEHGKHSKPGKPDKR